MRTLTPTLGWPVVLLAIAACASGGSTRQSAPSAPVEGTYEYTANLPGQQVRGTFRFVSDTVLIDPAAEYCRPTVAVQDPLAFRYTCEGPGSFEQLQIRIDRRNPVQLSKWSATYRVQRRREVCTQYVVREGRQVCVQTQTETYETTESRTGTLQVRRIP